MRPSRQTFTIVAAAMAFAVGLTALVEFVRGPQPPPVPSGLASTGSAASPPADSPHALTAATAPRQPSGRSTATGLDIPTGASAVLGKTLSTSDAQYREWRTQELQRMFKQFSEPSEHEGLDPFHAGLSVAFIAAFVDLDRDGAFSSYAPGEHVRLPAYDKHEEYCCSSGGRLYVVDAARFPTLTRLRRAWLESGKPVPRDVRRESAVPGPALSDQDRKEICDLYTTALDHLTSIK